MLIRVLADFQNVITINAKYTKEATPTNQILKLVPTESLYK